jgi:hypothetical protein
MRCRRVSAGLVLLAAAACLGRIDWPAGASSRSLVVPRPEAAGGHGAGRDTVSSPPHVAIATADARSLQGAVPAREARFDVAALERGRVLRAAGRLLGAPPITVTATHSARSAGGLHDFFSEGDYWWPDPGNPEGPYIQRDGMSNPDNFVEHRRAVMRLSEHVSTLTSAWILTGDERYAAQAMTHLRAWFVDPATRMNPSLRFAQAIRGRATGRGTGIIDTVHLVEVARSARLLAASRSAGGADVAAIRAWFDAYLRWLTTDKNGIEERDAKNNHGTCWVMQVAAFAELTGDLRLLDECRRRYKEVLLPGQMAQDGSFPLELKRTKPYGYSLFNLDAFATICQILSSGTDNLWNDSLPDGRGMKRAVAFIFPFMKDKAAWPFGRDVMYFDEWPVRQPSLLFAGLAYHEQAYLDLWERLDPAPASEEVLRNLPVRHPLLWVTAGRPRPGIGARGR